MNCLLYTDDVVSEKYHNEGELSYITTLSLSIISTAIASFVSAVLENLTNYISILQEILYNSKNEQKCHINMKRFFKYLYKRITCFIFVDIILISALSYYLIIFCSIYKNSLKSIFINYIAGVCISLAIAVGISLVIVFLRLFSLKKESLRIYIISRYIYEKVL